MIKKYKNFIIELPSIQMMLDDISRITNIIKEHKLGVIKIYNGEDKKVNLKKIDKEIIYELIIDVSAKNRKDDFKICFLKKGSYIQYHNEIDSDKLLILIKIEEIIKEKKVLSLPKKISSNIHIINSLFLMIVLSIYPIIKSINISNLLLGILIMVFLFLYATITFLDVNTIIIISIRNKFKRFYYKYYSINNLIRAIITSLILISSLYISSYFITKFRS